MSFSLILGKSNTKPVSLDTKFSFVSHSQKSTHPKNKANFYPLEFYRRMFGKKLIQNDQIFLNSDSNVWSQ